MLNLMLCVNSLTVTACQLPAALQTDAPHVHGSSRSVVDIFTGLIHYCLLIYSGSS